MIFPQKFRSTERGSQLAQLYSNRASQSNPFVTFLDFIQNQKTTVLTDGELISWSLKDSINARITLGGNRTLVLEDLVEGEYGTLVIKQDATGSRTLTLPTSYDNYVAGDGQGELTLSTTPNSIDTVSFYFDGDIILWNIGTNYTKKP